MDTTDPITQPAQPGRHRRLIIILTAAVAAAAAAIALAASGGGGQAMHGTLTVSTSSGDSSFCGPAVTDPGPGAQVSVTSPSGEVIGTGQLAEAKSPKPVSLLGCVMAETDYSFSVPGLPGEARYGVQVAGLTGTIWVNRADLAHAGLSVGG